MRHTLRNIVVRCFLYLSLLSALPAFAADMPKEDFSAISPLVQSWIDKGYYPWAVLRVYQGDKLLYAGHWGCYDQADNIANIASRKKFITSMVVADRELSRAEGAVTRLKDPRFSAAEVNAAELEDLRDLIRKV